MTDPNLNRDTLDRVRRKNAIDRLAVRVLDAVDDARADSASARNIAKALITIGKSLLVASSHEPPVH